MSASPDAGPVFAFEDFELDPATLELRRDGEALDVQLKVVDLLLHLLRHRDRIVEKDELFEVLWPDEVVSEASLTQAVKTARRVLGDDGAAQRLIKTVRGRGYRFVGPLRSPPEANEVRAVAAAPPAEGSTPAHAALEEAVAGAGRFVVLVGEAGSGKSTLAAELAQRAEAAGLPVHRIPCADVAGAPEGWPWRELLAGLEPAPFADPALDAWRAHSQPGPLPHAERFAVVRALARGLGSLAAGAGPRPLLLLEDLQHADPLTLEVVRALALDLESSGLVMVATRRPDAGPPPLDELLAELSTKRGCVSVALSGLSREGVRELVAAELCEEPPGAFVDALLLRSGGNPWAVRRILEHWRTCGLAGGGRFGTGLQLARAGVPAEVDVPLLRRLDAVSPRTRELLEVASVLEGPFPERLLREVAQAAPATVTAVADEALQAGLLARDDRGLRFRGPALRAAVQGAVPPARRRELHRRAARRLELSQLGQGDRGWDAIARHYFDALPSGDVDKCLGFLRAAARTAEERGDRAAARDLLERARLAVEQHRGGDRELRAGIDAWLRRLGEP